ncbi:MAG: gliding motility-associated ABC transporter permease subunit GldF [Bacteroidia bacterium]|nr:MAG: gliding motility-associated ABC transporter permease subunit GldF [Bacteroidia bacterium]
MFPVYRKEIQSFFSSLTGWVVIIVYLLINGLFMWILPGEWNILDSGYAGLETLFVISPWVFLFLVPAVTMRIFSEERRTGTMELLITRPLTERDILYAKFFAAVTLVLLSLTPSIFYYVTVYFLGETPGNIDQGGTLGAMAGLFFLASVYAAAGLFASALSTNQVVAFIISVFIGFILFIGFDSFAMIPALGKIDELIVSLGINEHYKSMSRGVIDLDDILYFGVVTLIFTEATRLVLVSRNWRRGG